MTQGVGCPSEGGGRDYGWNPLHRSCAHKDGDGFWLDGGSGEDWAGTPRGRDLSACQPEQLCGRGVLPVARGPDNRMEGGKQGATGKLLFRNLNFTATVVRQQGRDHRGGQLCTAPNLGQRGLRRQARILRAACSWVEPE